MAYTMGVTELPDKYDLSQCLTASSSGESSASGTQGGSAGDHGVSGSNPAARKRTHRSCPRVAPSTPVTGGQFRTYHHQEDGGGQDYDDSHRQPQAGVPFAAADDGRKDGYGQGFGLLGDMCALGDLLSAGIRGALSDEEGQLDPEAAGRRWLADPLSDQAVDAVLTHLLHGDDKPYHERFAVVTDFDELLFAVEDAFERGTEELQRLFLRSKEVPPHEPYGFHYMILLLLRTGNIVTNMDAAVDLAGYDSLHIKASSDFQDRSPTSMLAAFMTNLRVFHRDMLIGQDGEEATGTSLAEAIVTGHQRPPAPDVQNLHRSSCEWRHQDVHDDGRRGCYRYDRLHRRRQRRQR